MNRAWLLQFSSETWKRGSVYYHRGAVESLRKTENGYSAVVHGTEDYTVSVCLDGDIMLDIVCTCPHALKGFKCKHMAAVVLAMEESPCEMPSLDEGQLSEVIKDSNFAEQNHAETLPSDEKLSIATTSEGRESLKF